MDRISTTGNEPPFKRYRRDIDSDPTNPNPSKVVHVRNLNSKATEADLLEALSVFGPIAYATCIPHSRMALVEFEEIDGAKACVTYAQSSQISVGGQVALFNFSTSQEIERIGFESSSPNKVLVLTVLNAQYPIDADVIHQICQPQGNVLRIVVMHKPTIVQALVEFENADIAKAAKHAMNGADIYSGCCTLKVEFAKPRHVRVTKQDKDQRDYTLSNSDSGYNNSSRHNQFSSNRDFPITHESFDRAYNSNSYDRDPRYNYDNNRGFRGDYDAPPVSSNRGDGYRRDDYSRSAAYDSYDNNPARPNYTERRDTKRPVESGHGGGPGCVLLVYGLDTNKVNCDMLFNCLCLYGNVIRISFMKSKSGTGMVEMGSPEERKNVLQYISRFELFNLTVEFKPSHQESVHSLRDPYLLSDGTPSFRDYSGSRNNRFVNPLFASKNRITHPSNVLHWYNAPATITEEKIREMVIEKTNHVPIRVDVFPSKNDRSSAGNVEFESVKVANEVLALINHTPVDSPLGNTPYITKWAYAISTKRDGGSEARHLSKRSRTYSDTRRSLESSENFMGNNKGSYNIAEENSSWRDLKNY